MADSSHVLRAGPYRLSATFVTLALNIQTTVVNRPYLNIVHILHCSVCCLLQFDF